MSQARRHFSRLTYTMAFFLLATALSISAATPESESLGVATDFTVFVAGDYTASSGSINGRIAAGGNINLNSYSVGGQAVQGDSPEALLAGGDIHFSNGSVSQGNIIAAGSVSGVGSNVVNTLSSNQQLLGGQTLRFSFSEEFQKLTALSGNLSQLTANGSVDQQGSSLLLEGDCVSNTQVFNLNGTLLSNANTLNVNCIPTNATVIINVAGTVTGFTNMGIGNLGANGKVLFNLYEASNVSITGVSISAGILAPLANVEAANGHVNGFVVASAWNGAVSLEFTAFEGVLPSVVSSSSSSSSSLSSTSSLSSSTSSIVVSSSSLSSVSSSSVISSSSSSSVAPVDFTITTEVSLGGSITPENLVVTGGEVITLDVITELGSELFSIVGCGGSYEAFTNVYTTGEITKDCTVSANFLPLLKLEAESYLSMNGVEIENVASASGEAQVGSINHQDTMNYSIGMVREGLYLISFDGASGATNGKLQLESADGNVIYGTAELKAGQGIAQMLVVLPSGQFDFTLRALSDGWTLDKFSIAPVLPSTTSIASLSPLVVQAEDYTSMNGIQTEATSDVGGGLNVGWIDTQDWMTYPVSISKEGVYNISYRVASLQSGGKFQVTIQNNEVVIDTVEFSTTEGWQNWISVEKTLVLPAGDYDLTITALSGGWNINKFELNAIAANTPSVEPLPFITIEAEDYLLMQGVQNETTTDVNGGLNVGSIDANDWMRYAVNVPKKGLYKITYRIASGSNGGQFELSAENSATILDAVSFESTGGFQNWKSVESLIYLEQGSQELVLKARGNGWNINKFSLEFIPYSAFQYQLFNGIAIQAEDYVDMAGVQTAPNQDTDNSLSVNSLNAQDWMKYTVNLPYTGLYSVKFRIASENAGQFSIASTLGSVQEVINFNATGGNENWTTVSVELNLTAGVQELLLTALSNDWQLNWLELKPIDPSSSSSSSSSSVSSLSSSSSSNSSSIESSSSTASSELSSSSIASSSVSSSSSIIISSSSNSSSTSSASSAESSSSSVSSSSVSSSIESSSSVSSSVISSSNSSLSSSVESSSSSSLGSLNPSDFQLKIEAEDYSYSELENAQIEPNQDVENGLSVTELGPQDRLSYDTDVPYAGEYRLKLRVSSETGGSFSVSTSNYFHQGVVEIEPTGGNENWVTIEMSLNLRERLQLSNFSGDVNINWLELSIPYNGYVISTIEGTGGHFDWHAYIVHSGEQVSFYVYNDWGYDTVSVVGCGAVSDGNRRYTTAAITENCTIEANFVVDPWAPEAVRVVGGDSQLSLAWEDSKNLVESYNIYYATEPGVTPDNYLSLENGTLIENATSPFNLTGLDNSLSYYMVVTSLYGDRESIESEEVTITPSPAGGVIANRYQVLGGGVVRDLVTGLEWQRCAIGQTWDGETCNGTVSLFSGPTSFLGEYPEGWRGPSLSELRTLVYCSSGSPRYWNHKDADVTTTYVNGCTEDYNVPTIMPEVFPSTSFNYPTRNPGRYWTTTGSGDSKRAVSFLDGTDQIGPDSNAIPVRLVRGAYDNRTLLRVDAEGSGSGTIVSTPAFIDCGKQCVGDVAENIEVTLTAAPLIGNEFIGWTGDCIGSDITCTFTVGEDTYLNVDAIFRKPPAERYEFIEGGSVVHDLTTGLEWKRCSQGQLWNGQACAGSASRSYHRTQPQGSAQGEWRLPQLEELKTLIYCNSGLPAAWKNSNLPCSGNYNPPTIDQEAFPNTSSSNYWSITAQENNTARFWGVRFKTGEAGTSSGGWSSRARLVRTPLPEQLELSVNISGTGSGIITSTPSGINCGSACTASFTNGEDITLAAIPTAGSIFVGWTGACVNTALTCTLSVSGAEALTVQAMFISDLQAIIETPQTLVTVGSNIILNGANSTVTNGEIVSYRWTRVSDGEILSTEATLELSDLAAGSYEFELQVEDSAGQMVTTIVTIEVGHAPVAVAPESITGYINTDITVSGQDSHIEAGTLTYAWLLNGELVSEASQFVLNLPEDGSYLLELVVTSELGLSDTKIIPVEITSLVEGLMACPYNPPVDDYAYVAQYPDTDIDWQGGNAETVADIARAFNHARKRDPSVSQYLLMPEQTVWDAMSVPEKALYLINAERAARGIKPYAGYDAAMNQVSQNYAQYMHSDNQVIGHYNNGLSPRQRMELDEYIDTNADSYILKAESVAAAYNLDGPEQETYALIRAIYGWLYEDKEWFLAFGSTDGEPWGHRDQLLQTSLQENHGAATEEGIIGVGHVMGIYDPTTATPSGFGAVTVLNTIDQSSSWDNSRLGTVDITQAQGCLPYTLDLDENDPVLAGLQRLSIEPNSMHLAIGQSATLTLMGHYANDTQQDLTSLAVFTADDYSAVTISQGQVTALSAGRAKVYAQVGTIQSNRIFLTVAPAADTSLFIGTSGAWVIPYIAENATIPSLVPDAEGHVNQQDYNPFSMAVFTGLVHDRNGDPMADVLVSFLNAQNYGSTTTDIDGRFALAGPAGKQAVVYEKAGHLVVQRTTIAASNHWASLETVQLLPRDTKQTLIDLSAGQTQVHQSSIISDEYGERKATIVFNGITSAVIRSRDGSVRPITELTLSATEYETPTSMPGELPNESSFTWASDLHVEGVHYTDTVVYNGNVVMFVDNFLGFPVGEIIPKGYYNHVNSEWEALANGVVVELLDENSDGVVDGLDYTGDGIADDLNGNGNTADDALGLSGYSAGETLWWGSFPHMSPIDYNWASGDAEAPFYNSIGLAIETSEEDENKEDCFDCEGSSYAKPEPLSYHEIVLLPGTDIALDYSSQRTDGYDHKMYVKVSGNEIPASVQKMYARVEIAGQVFEQEFSPEENVEAEFIWDGSHPDGSEAQGLVRGKVSIGYEYQTMYQSAGNAANDGEDLSSYPVAWATLGDVVTQVPGREAVVTWKEEGITLKNSHNSQLAAGWSLSTVHELDPAGKVYLGNGSVQDVASPSLILRTGQTYSLVDGDDGFYQAGGRNIDYTINNENILVDLVTGLEWQNIQTPFRTISKAEAINYCNTLAEPLNSGWRLPTPKEVGYTISKSGDSAGQRIYSLTQARNMWHQRTLNSDLSLLSTVCVRGELLDNRTIVNLERNDTQEVVLDQDNGLMWQDSTDNINLTVDWEGSIEYCEASTHAGFNNWRLPNINELLYALPNTVFQFQTALPPGATWNYTVPYRKPYWSSTTNLQNEEQAWASESASFNSERFIKLDSLYVRCVREEGSAARMPYVFNDKGQHSATIDTTTGKELSRNEYNNDGLLVRSFNRFGDETRIERNSAGVPQRIIAPDGEVTTLDIDAQGDLKEIIYEDGTRHRFNYKEGHLLTLKTDPNGNEFIRHYNDEGRIEKIETPTDGFWDVYNERTEPGVNRYGYVTAEGNTFETIRRRLENGDIETTTTGETGGQRTITRSEDDLTRSVARYGMSSTVNSVLDAKTLQPIPQNITVTAPSGLTNTTIINKAYAENGADMAAYTVNLTNNGHLSVIDINGHTGVQSYTSPEGRVKTTYSDPETLLLDYVEVAGLHNVTYDYDLRGRLEETLIGTRKTIYTYDDEVDGFGHLKTITAPDLKQTHYEYDLMGRVKAIIYPDSYSTLFDYDENGNTKKVTVPTLAEHDFIYNGINQIDTQDRPEFESTTYDYNLDGQLKQINLTSGETIVYEYEQGRLDKVKRPAGDTIYRYQLGDQLDEVQIGSELVDYNYDGTLLTQLRYEGHLNTSIDYGYNADFRIDRLTYAGGNTSIAYDDDGLLTGIHGYTIDYNALNGLPEEVSIGQWSQSLGWNQYGEVEAVDYSFNTQAIFNYSLDYNNVGQIVTKTEQLSNSTVDVYEYDYDDRQRLIEVLKNSAVVEAYNYDENGNRELRTSIELGITNQAASYNTGDQLESQGNTTYGYDANARLSEKLVVDGANSSLTTYIYDTQGNLKQVDTPTQSISYEHNALGNRVVKLVDGTIVEKYLWQDLTTLLATYDGQGNLKQRFEYALGHTPVSFTQDGQSYFIQTDHLGTPRVITDSVGAVVKTISYDSFGSVISDSNSGFEIPFGFAGGLYDKDTKLVRFGFRDYDPEIGRWTARDPIGFSGGSANLYGYVFSDPVNLVDRTGLDVDINLLPYVNLPGNSSAPLARDHVAAITPPPGSLSLSGHGYPSSIETRIGSIRKNAEQIAEMLKNLEDYDPNKPIYLYSCKTGKGENSIAQQLHEILGNPVYAPPVDINVNQDGRVSPSITEWREFK